MLYIVKSYFKIESAKGSVRCCYTRKFTDKAELKEYVRQLTRRRHFDHYTVTVKEVEK